MIKPKSKAAIDPIRLKKATLMRQTGWTVACISTKLNISPSTLFKYFKTHDIVQSSTMIDSLETAKSQLLTDAGFIGELKEKIASQLTNDLAIASMLNESLITTLERLNKDCSGDINAHSRSLAALSTSLKTTSEIQRKALGISDNNGITNADELPILTVRCMSEQEEIDLKDSKNDKLD